MCDFLDNSYLIMQSQHVINLHEIARVYSCQGRETKIFWRGVGGGGGDMFHDKWKMVADSFCHQLPREHILMHYSNLAHKS